jgi:aconitase B
MSSSFTPQKIEFMKAGGSYAIVFGKKLQTLRRANARHRNTAGLRAVQGSVS